MDWVYVFVTRAIPKLPRSQILSARILLVLLAGGSGGVESFQDLEPLMQVPDYTRRRRVHDGILGRKVTQSILCAAQ